jgi:hypothetical protein
MVNGEIVAIPYDKSEVVLSENIKNWVFQLVNADKVRIMAAKSKLGELEAAESAIVTSNQQESESLTSNIGSARR